jgi:hypothetical protein
MPPPVRLHHFHLYEFWILILSKEVLTIAKNSDAAMLLNDRLPTLKEALTPLN